MVASYNKGGDMAENDTNEIQFSDDLGEEKIKIEIPTEERKLITQAYDKSVSDLVSLMNDEEIILNPEY